MTLFSVLYAYSACLYVARVAGLFAGVVAALGFFEDLVAGLGATLVFAGDFGAVLDFAGDLETSGGVGGNTVLERVR